MRSVSEVFPEGEFISPEDFYSDGGPARSAIAWGVGDVAKEDFGADGDEFSGVGYGQPPYSLIRTRSRPAIARSHSASMSSTASSSRTSSTWGLVLGWRGVKTVQQSS